MMYAYDSTIGITGGGVRRDFARNLTAVAQLHAFVPVFHWFMIRARVQRSGAPVKPRPTKRHKSTQIQRGDNGHLSVYAQYRSIDGP